MKIKSSSIWTYSPCSIAFPERNVALERCQRFSLHSIYYKGKIQSQNRKIPLQIIRPDSALIEFRQKIQQCQNYRKSLSRMSRSVDDFRKIEHKQSKQSKVPTKFNQQLIQRLTANKENVELDFEYDRNGQKSTLYTSNGQENIRYSFKKSQSIKANFKRKINGPKVYVSGSYRLDFSRPQNFYPGPGSYFMDKRDNEHVALLYTRAHKSCSKSELSESHPETNERKEPQNMKFFQDTAAKVKNSIKKKKSRRTSTSKIKTKIKQQVKFTNKN